MFSQVLTVDEAAERLRISPDNVRRLIRAGALRAARIGQGRPGYRILDSEVERFASGEPLKEEA